MTDLVATCVLPVENHLGESPIWCELRQRLYWVDTRAPLIWWFEPDTGSTDRSRCRRWWGRSPS